MQSKPSSKVTTNTREGNGSPEWLQASTRPSGHAWYPRESRPINWLRKRGGVTFSFGPEMPAIRGVTRWYIRMPNELLWDEGVFLIMHEIAVPAMTRTKTPWMPASDTRSTRRPAAGCGGGLGRPGRRLRRRAGRSPRSRREVGPRCGFGPGEWRPRRR